MPMYWLSIIVDVCLWSLAGYVAVHIYEDWRRRHPRKSPTLRTYSNAIWHRER